MARAIILMMDSFGIGGAPDGAKYGNDGADTLGHIAAAGKGLNIPNLHALGLSEAAKGASGKYPAIGTQKGTAVADAVEIRACQRNQHGQRYGFRPLGNGGIAESQRLGAF